MPLVDGQLNGKYRQLLLSPDRLEAELNELRPQLLVLQAAHTAGQLSDAGFVARFVLTFALRRAYGAQWFNLRRCARFVPYAGQVLGGVFASDAALADLLKNAQLRGMPAMIFVILYQWLNGLVELRLSHCPVSAAAMLEAQAGGWRYVTVDFDHALAAQLIDGKRDAFEFALHDLGHAYTFFRPEHDPVGQVRFFSLLQTDLTRLAALAEADTKFAADLEYCMADMNSHPEHLRQYLRGVITEAYYRLRQCEKAEKYGEDQLKILLASLSCLVAA